MGFSKPHREHNSARVGVVKVSVVGKLVRKKLSRSQRFKLDLRHATSVPGTRELLPLVPTSEHGPLQSLARIRNVERVPEYKLENVVVERDGFL